MGMKCGIVGLPNVGKSTLFNAITEAGAGAENYPFCTIDPNVGIVDVPDERLKYLTEVIEPQVTIPTAIEFVDIAGLVEGASKGEGLGNKFLSHIREVDAIVHVVRCFEDQNITHVEGDLNPIRDIETIKMELILADLETIEGRMKKTEKMLKTGEKIYKEEMLLWEKLRDTLESAQTISSLDLTTQEQQQIRDCHLLTVKPVLYVANIGEEEIKEKEENHYLESVEEYALQEKAEVVTISASIEAEVAELEAAEKRLFLEELGLEESGLDKLIRAGYKLLGLITFFTAGEKEVRAWTVKKGSTAPEAAGKIHSDMEKGFIRAEVVSYEELIKAASFVKARENGELRLEGKDYIIKDGDVCHFRFNV